MRSLTSWPVCTRSHAWPLPGVKARENAIEELEDALIWPKRACAAEQGMIFKVSVES